MTGGEQRVRILQWLCPSRHCIMGLAYESEDGAEQPARAHEMKAGFEVLVREGKFNPWCELCKAPLGQWHTEDAASPFRTLAEARPALEWAQREQQFAQMVITRRHGNG